MTKTKKISTSKKNLKGFTFVEVIYTMFVLAAVMVAVAGIHSSLTKSYRKTALTQKDLEQAQYALNLMAKVLRTSFVTAPLPVSPATNVPSSAYIIVYDKSRDKCVRFQFDSYKLKTASANAVGGNEKEKIDNCKTSPPAVMSLEEITNTHVNAGYFDVTPTVLDEDDRIESTGKVTTVMNICPSSGCATSPPVIIQSTVSLRQHKEISPAF